MKRLNYYLGIAVLLIITIVSCRNEIFTEVPNKDEIQSSLLRSKFISLDQSKHKNEVITELSVAKKQLKNVHYKSKSGRLVSYNNASIDTDNVIYIEHGSNYHTYTFNIVRDNPEPDAPIENLILTPLPDGSYKEYLATYTVTDKEKEQIRLGNGFDSKGKVKIVELEKGTYNNDNSLFSTSSLSEIQNCGLVVVTICVACYSGDHNASNIEEWGNCKWEERGGNPPQIYTVIEYRCTSVDDGSGVGLGDGIGDDTGWNGGDGSNDGGTSSDGGTGSGGTGDCSGTGVYTSPQDPSAGTGTGCDDGFPTLPNLGDCKGGKIKDASGNCVCPQGKEENSFGNCVTPCDTSKEDLKKVFPNANDIVLQDMANAINKYGKDFGIDTKEKLQHFLAQAGHESAKFTVFTENLNYRWEKLGVSNFKKYFNPISSPNLDPNKANPNDYKRSSTSAYVNSEKLANYVYGNRMGNDTYGDGYKYRGRGIFQLTGKSNYTTFNNFYRSNYDSSVDIINNPDLLINNKEIMVISALWYYKNNVLNRIKVNENTSVTSVSVIVNGGTNGLNDRIQIFNIAINIIKCL